MWLLKKSLDRVLRTLWYILEPSYDVPWSITLLSGRNKNIIILRRATNRLKFFFTYIEQKRGRSRVTHKVRDEAQPCVTFKSSHGATPV